MKRLRVDSAWISGGYLQVGEPGFGVLGAAIPATGTDGPPPLYNDISLPAEANDEFRALLSSVPSGGSFFMFEDSSFIATGYADGVYTGTYEGFKNGVSYGSASFSFTIGSSTVTPGHWRYYYDFQMGSPNV